MTQKITIRTGPLTKRQRMDYERRMAELEKQLAPIVKAIRDSKRLTAADYAVTVNRV